MEEEKTSEFLEKYTKEHPDTGQKYIDAIGAINEMYTRVKSLKGTIEEIYTALADAGGALKDLNDRVGELEGKKKIEVIAPDANISELIKAKKY